MRRWIPHAGLLLLAGATIWAVSFGTQERADFTFCNGTEIKSIDPAVVTGSPEGRIIRAVFEGLANLHPETLQPIPGVAENVTWNEQARRWDCVSDDGLTYTFRLRREARWSDGSAVTAHDFVYSFRRFLDPLTAAEYSYLLYDHVAGARKYVGVEPLQSGDPVEIELLPEPAALPGARGRLLHGTLVEVHSLQPAASSVPVYVVDVGGQRHRFTTHDPPPDAALQPCRQVLLDFREVGIRALDERTLEIRLVAPRPYFMYLMGFYPLFPVHQGCVERHGYPDWTRPENLVCNGPYRIAERRLRDRIRLVKNPYYWNQANVHFETIDALAVESDVTMLNMYEAGLVDWITTVPNTMIPELLRLGRDDFQATPMLGIYYYRVNCRRKPLDDPRVRQALSLAIDRQQIVTTATAAGEVPAHSFVPPGLAGYTPQECLPHDVAAARRLLAEAGYPGGKGFPRLEILYNTNESHRAIAELIERQWRHHLGIDARLRNVEWATYLASVRQGDYQVARAGWIGDYPDPNTFLDLFVTDGPNNQTGWSHAGYDRLLDASLSESDPQQRMELLQQAERILMDELPVIPLYYYVSKNMIRPYVRGFYPNPQDLHSYVGMRIDPQEKRAYWEKQGRP
jgi:oligopeptide transport system substrate-binding protein